MSIKSKDILQHMEVPGRPGLYVLGVFESRVTVYSQQVRALNLIYSLFREKRLEPSMKVAVIGAGVAGLTVAVAAACQGAEVTVLERLSEPLALIRRSSKRWLHPHIYEWPRKDDDLPDPLEPDAGLPLLNWRANTVDHVRDQLIKQYNQAADKFGIDFWPHVSDVSIIPGDEDGFGLSWNQRISDGPFHHPFQCDVVILAVGFGLEQSVDKLQTPFYWESDGLEEEDARIHGRAKRILISGTGDGGLIDVLRVRFKHFAHAKIVKILTEDLLDQDTLKWLTERLLIIEDQAEDAVARQKSYQVNLNQAYHNLVRELRSRVDILSHIGLRSDTEVVITSKSDLPLSLRSSILNRFLYSLLGVKYLKGPWTYHHNDDGTITVTFGNEKQEIFDQIVVRHGPESALKKYFFDIWERCAPLRTLNALDQTRIPIYGDFYRDCVLEEALPEVSQDTTAGLGEPDAKRENSDPHSTTPSRLRTGTAKFIGRDEDIEVLKDKIKNPQTRLLTLCGTGGVGKTELAIKIANAVSPEYQAVKMVDLAALSRVASEDQTQLLVVQAIASALGVLEEQNYSLLDTVRAYLGPKKILLLLDNCEHLIHACAQVSESLLDECPELKIVATSREPLKVEGECRHEVKRLPVPLQGSNYEQLKDNEAVQLFVHYTQMVVSTFSLTQENATVVAEICRQVEGLPLAIKLIAAWLKPLGSVDRIAERLTSGPFPLRYKAGNRTNERQTTMSASIAWSYGHLDEPEQQLFDRLAVFPYDWTEEAAQEICTGSAITTEMIPDLLWSLVDKSLVERMPDDGRTHLRYRFLRPTRDYASEYLDKEEQKSEKQALQRKHLSYYCRRVEDLELKLRGGEQIKALLELEQEQANWRAALEWSHEDVDGAGLGLRLAGALAEFWFIHGPLSEGCSELERILKTNAQLQTRDMAKAMAGAGLLAWAANELENAKKYASDSLTLYRTSEDHSGIAKCQHILGLVERRQGNCQRAQELFQGSLRSFQKLNDKWDEAWSTLELGSVHRANNELPRDTRLEWAEDQYKNSLSLFQEIGSPRGIGWSLNLLGFTAHLEGRWDEAQNYFERALHQFRQARDQRGISTTLHNLGSLARDRLNYPQAIDYYARSVVEFKKQGDRRGVANVIRDIGSVERKRGNYQAAKTKVHEAWRMFSRLNDVQGKGWCHHEFGWIAYDMGDYGGAREHFGTSLSLLGEGRQEDGIAWVSRDLGALLRDQGKDQEAKKHLKKSRKIFKEWKNKRGIAWVSHDLATITRRAGKYSSAAICLKISFSLFKEARDEEGMAYSLHQKGRLNLDQHYYREAFLALAEGLTIFQKEDHVRGIASSLHHLTLLTQSIGELNQPNNQLLERAAKILGAVEALHEARTIRLPLVDQQVYETSRDKLRAGLGGGVFDAAWSEGRTMELDRVIADALKLFPIS